MLVGNQEEATLIHEWYYDHHDRCGAPEGWKYLNAGSFRAAYLSPSGVVYKVQKYRQEYGYQSNKGEYDKWRDLYFNCKMPRHSRLPKMGYFPTDDGSGVIAMERFTKPWSPMACIPDTEGMLYWNDVVSEISEKCKVGDLFGDNLYMTDDGREIVPVDLADTW